MVPEVEAALRRVPLSAFLDAASPVDALESGLGWRIVGRLGHVRYGDGQMHVVARTSTGFVAALLAREAETSRGLHPDVVRWEESPWARPLILAEALSLEIDRVHPTLLGLLQDLAAAGEAAAGRSDAPRREKYAHLLLTGLTGVLEKRANVEMLLGLSAPQMMIEVGRIRQSLTTTETAESVLEYVTVVARETRADVDQETLEQAVRQCVPPLVLDWLCLPREQWRPLTEQFLGAGGFDEHLDVLLNEQALQVF